MKPIIQKFKAGDKLEINCVENGFLIVHKTFARAYLRPLRHHPSVIDNGMDELEEAELDEQPRGTKCYIAENSSDVTKIITEILSKEQKA